ncbi:MAG: hypothetical protein K2X81_24820 [Candidatus Obscuribacterales bacterium]|nr:hypothetical protein [Candidatus Obscuribacterales bacterium]
MSIEIKGHKVIPSSFFTVRDGFKFSLFQKITVGTLLIFVWGVFYIQNLFPVVPAVLGGGQPRAVALLVSKETLQILATFGISAGEGATYQTQSLCTLSESNDGVIVIAADRVLLIKSSLYSGLISLPGPNAINEQPCIQYLKSWVSQGLYGEILLLEVSISNEIGTLFGLENGYLTWTTYPNAQ